MPTDEERKLVLRMVDEGKVSAEEGARLLEALGKTDQPTVEAEGAKDGDGRYVRIRVSDATTGSQKVAVNLPASVVTFGLRFIPPQADFDVQAVRDALQAGLTGSVVDLVDDEENRRVEVFID